MVDLNMFHELKNRNIENLFIFVCDTLRWDFVPEELVGRGLTVKTVASSLFTASSFPSICTGLYPPRHGILGWQPLSAEGTMRSVVLQLLSTEWTESHGSL